MRIAFWLLQDSIRQWSGWVAGLHYVKNCLEALTVLSEDLPFEIVAFAPESLKEKLLDDAGFRDAQWFTAVWVDDALLSDPSKREQLDELVARERCDMLFPAISPPGVPTAGKCIGWITDLQHKHYPQFFSDAELKYRDQLFAFLAASSTRIVCSSIAVRNDIQEHYPEVEDRTSVLRFRTRPPESAIQSHPATVLSELGIHGPYAYLPYQFWKHKNHALVFEAWAKLRDRGHVFSLICTGATVDARDPEHFSTLREFIDSHGLGNDIQILGMVPRNQQWQLYRGAKLILQPSLFEGWSTSVEEARSLGKPVYLSDIDVHREQMEGTGVFFDSADSTALAEQIESDWSRLPDGFDPERESQALASNRDHQKEFGQDLVTLFSDAMLDTRRPIAPSVLPLLLSIQNEADKRLDLIHALSADLERLKGCSKMEVSDETTSRIRMPRWMRRLASRNRSKQNSGT